MRILSVALLLAVTLIPPPIMASTTYYYTGNDFYFVYSLPYTTSDSVSGSFTVTTALADSTTYYAAQLEANGLSYSFSDGVSSYSGNSNIYYNAYDATHGYNEFFVTTGPSGGISYWSIWVFNSTAGTMIVSDPGGVVYGDDVAAYPGRSDITAAYTGSWSIGASPESAVPEPSSLVLLVTGAVSLAGMVRRRFRRQ